MGSIKLPKKSIEFFQNNYEEIFQAGALAEGKWNLESSTIVKEFTGMKHSIPVSSNGTGMVAMMQLMKHLYSRDTVLIQSNTMYGVKTMVNASGLELKGIIDCDPIFLVPNLEMIEKYTNTFNNDQKSRLIILISHIGGIINPWMEEIAQYCKNENIMLLEDCAHSYAALLNNKHSGSYGDAGVYSFYSTKAIFSGEGGMIVTDNDELGELAKKYIMYDRFDRKLPVANNIRQSELQALMLTGVLREVNEILINKKTTADKYIKCCKSLGLEYIQQDNKNMGNCY